MRALALILLATLAGCTFGSRSEPRLEEAAVQFVLGQLNLGPQAEEGAEVDPRRVLTREILAQAPAALIVVEQEDGGVSTMLEQARNDGVVTYRSRAGFAVILDRGVLFGTRGFGYDLHTVNTAAARRVLSGSGDIATERTHRILDGNNQIFAERFVCAWADQGLDPIVLVQIRYQTRRVTETCESSRNRFVNEYWVDGTGVVWQSRQWIGPRLGHFLVQQLVR